MESTPIVASITLGHITLTQGEDGQLKAHHTALSAPVEIDALQLQRWLLRQLRELVTA